MLHKSPSFLFQSPNLPLEVFFCLSLEFRQISPKFKMHLILKLIVWLREAFSIVRGTRKSLTGKNNE